MSFPGKKAGTAYSFGEVKGMVEEHKVTNPPNASLAAKKYPLTMAEFSNIEGGEKYGERNVKAPHISHK